MNGLTAKALKINPIDKPPSKVETMIFQLPIPVRISINAPISIARVDVSPMEPGMNPRNISIAEGILSIW